VTTRTAQAIEFVLAEPATTVFATDFDGTVAAIVEDPTTARAADGVAESLVRIAAALQRVAIISGRPVAFLRDRLGDEVAVSCALFGRYGAEELRPDGSILRLGGGGELTAVVARLRQEAHSVDPRVLVEDKSNSVTLHWRSVPEAESALRELAGRQARESGLEMRGAKMSVELVHAGAPTKGSTVDRLLRETTTACCFVGDDVGDLDAFDALDRFASTAGRALRIAVASDEMPVELADRADLVVSGPSAAAALLSRLASALDAR